MPKEFSKEAIKSLCYRNYPGNVRELKHIVTRAAVLSNGPIIDEQIITLTSGATAITTIGASQIVKDYSAFDFKTSHRMFENDYFSAVLARHDNNITATAAAIGMAQSNLSRKLKELGLRG